MPLRSINKINSIKESLATQAEWEFAKAVREERSAEAILNQMQMNFEVSTDAFTVKQQTGVSVQELLEWTEWMENQRQHIAAQTEFHQRLQQVSAACKAKLVEKHQEKEIWHRLKDHRLQLLQKEYRKQEQAELDEIGSRSKKKNLD